MTIDFGNGYMETMEGFGPVCPVCGDYAAEISSKYKNRDDSLSRCVEWTHEVRYKCGCRVKYKKEYSQNPDYTVATNCPKAHRIALDLKGKLEKVQEAVDGKEG